MTSLVEKLLGSAKPLVIAHRGYSSLAPENTLPSFQSALEAKADVIELDYQTSRDGMPMVIHDDTLDRTTNARAVWKQKRIQVASRTAEQIQSLDAGSWFSPKFAGTKVPSLTEALDLICGNGSVAMVEHKSGDAVMLAKLLRKGAWSNRVVVQSFDWRFLRELHELEPKLILGALGPDCCLVNRTKPSVLRSQRLNQRWLDDLQKTGARVVGWNRKVLAGAVQAAHARGLQVWIYTIDDWSIAKRLVAMSVDGIITNVPSREFQVAMKKL